MTKRPTEQRLGSGGLIDLLDPNPDLIDIVLDVARPMSRIGRFTSQADRPNQESVCEHSVIGAAVALAETGRWDLSLAFLMHDSHEGCFGDIATPIVAALAALVGPDLPLVITRLKNQLDYAVAIAAGTPTEWGPDVHAYVKDLDRRMYEAEHAALWCDPYDRRDKVQVALSPANQLRRELMRGPPFSLSRAVAKVVGPDGSYLGYKVDVSLDLARPWEPELAASVWLASLDELKALIP